MIIQVGATLRIRSIPDNWTIERRVVPKDTEGVQKVQWKVTGYFITLDSAFTHCGRHFLDQIVGEFGTDALPALFELTDAYKRLGQEAVARLPEIPS